MPDVTTNESYSVGAGSDTVVLAVVIGEGQIGTSRVRLDGAELVTATGPITVAVGKPATVKGKRLFIRSIINDVNSLTNRMSVTYRLTGGAAPRQSIANANAPNEGDVLVFEATFSLT